MVRTTRNAPQPIGLMVCDSGRKYLLIVMLHDENVLGLDVPVHDAHVVQVPNLKRRHMGINQTTCTLLLGLCGSPKLPAKGRSVPWKWFFTNKGSEGDTSRHGWAAHAGQDVDKEAPHHVVLQYRPVFQRQVEPQPRVEVAGICVLHENEEAGHHGGKGGVGEVLEPRVHVPGWRRKTKLLSKGSDGMCMLWQCGIPRASNGASTCGGCLASQQTQLRKSFLIVESVGRGIT